MPDRILVVDDDRAGRLSLAEILRLEGYDVTTADSGEDAVARLRNADHPFDLMLLDLKMPGMDGMAVLSQARQIAPETQIVFLTAHGSLESAIAALRHGAHDYLLKPAPSSDIRSSVQKGLERRHADLRRLAVLRSLESSLRELRADGLAQSPPTPAGREAGTGDSGRIASGGVVLDLAAHQASAAGKVTALTRNEVKLLACLMRRANQTVSPADIVREVQGFPATDREAAEIIRPIVSRLRRKLTQLPGAANIVVTVKGAGYRFESQ